MAAQTEEVNRISRGVDAFEMGFEADVGGRPRTAGGERGFAVGQEEQIAMKIVKGVVGKVSHANGGLIANREILAAHGLKDARARVFGRGQESLIKRESGEAPHRRGKLELSACAAGGMDKAAV